MKTRNKALLLSLCAVLLVATSVFGTMAYLTDNDTVTNTFTVGNVTFGDGNEDGLDEALVNEYGQPIDNVEDKNVVERTEAPRVQENVYKLVPGHKYTKDPTVHINNESEDCYVFVKIENGIEAIETTTEADTIAAQVLSNGWTALTGVEDVYWKKWTAPAEATDDATSDLVVFKSFTVNGAVEELAAYEDEEIKVTAYAIQTDGFTDATIMNAWNAVQ